MNTSFPKKFFLVSLFLLILQPLPQLSGQNGRAGNVNGELSGELSREEALRIAAEKNRPLLLIFSGSDWCIPCIKFERQVLSDTTFQSFAASTLLLLNADFPQRKHLPEELVKRNEELAEQYNPDGIFPHILLLKPDGSQLAVLSYDSQPGPEFIAQIEKYLSKNDPSKNDGMQNRDERGVGESDKMKSVPEEFSVATKLMGCGFEFTLVDADSAHAAALLQQSVDEVRRIEYLFSEWIDTTQASQVNGNAGIQPVKVAPEFYGLLQRSIDISRLTQGAFDVSFNGVGKLWKFDGSMTKLPDSVLVKSALKGVGFKKIKMLDSSRVFLPERGMKIGFGGIAKGYAADKVKKMLMDAGIASGVVNASGDLTAWGKRPDGTPWKVGIADPENPSNIILWLPVENAAVATSGSYEKYAEIDGVRYAHIIDPRTGYPVREVKSVTVISPSGELSDALATAVFVLGVEVGLNLIEQLPNTECIIIDAKNKIHHTKDLKFL